MASTWTVQSPLAKLCEQLMDFLEPLLGFYGSMWIPCGIQEILSGFMWVPYCFPMASTWIHKDPMAKLCEHKYAIMITLLGFDGLAGFLCG